MIEPVPTSEPLVSVPAAQAASHPASAMIVRVSCADDLSFLSNLPRERIAWVETSAELAEDPRLNDLALDVMLTDPARQAKGLYRLARLRETSPPRITISAVAGVKQAGIIAMALHFPVRIMPGQPDALILDELVGLLDHFLHDSQASEPVEFFHAAMGTLIHGFQSTLWEVCEADPASYRRLPDDGRTDDFVARHIAALRDSGAECATCPVQDWCAGFFKLPDPSYDCTGIRALLARIEQAAEQLRKDLLEAETIAP